MSVGESLSSHSLHSFAEFLQHHINSPEVSSRLTSRRKNLTVLKPFSLNFMAPEKSARKGGRQCRGNTSRDLPPDLYDLYKTNLEPTSYLWVNVFARWGQCLLNWIIFKTFWECIWPLPLPSHLNAVTGTCSWENPLVLIVCIHLQNSYSTI